MTYSDKEDTECRLRIGDVCCSLRFKDKDQDHCASARSYYKGFLSENAPDLTIDINIVLHNGEINLPDSLLMSKTVDGNDFDFRSGLIRGTLDLEGKRCTIDVNSELLRRSVRTFEQFLFLVYYTLSKQRNPGGGRNNFLIHSCAVSRDGLGYLFSGPSESGKSTIAKLSSDYSVLNDEVTIIKKKKSKKGNGTYTVSSTPFRGDFLDNVNVSVPLRAIFLIKHGEEENIIKRLSEKEFVARFIREVVYSDTLLSMNKKAVLLEMMDFCADVASTVPFYELQFLPDTRFWDSIDNLKIEGGGENT